MPVGHIQFYLSKKGYGYIRIPETRAEIFFSKKHLSTPINRGQKVRFQIAENQQGLYAINIKPLANDTKELKKND